MGKQITIIGCGPGAIDLITVKGKGLINKADIVVGSKRLINDFTAPTPLQKKELMGSPPLLKGEFNGTSSERGNSQKILILEQNYQEVLDEVKELIKGTGKKVVFLVSGDPLFYSYGELIIKKFGEDNCDIIPGISSVQYAFSKLKESWKDYTFLTLHGTKDVDIEKIFKENNKFALLLDPKNNLKMIKNKLKSNPASNYKFRIISNLSLPEEKILGISLDDFDKIKEESLSILIVNRLNKDEQL